MNSDLSIIALVVNASPVVKIVLALLLIASIASWAVIFEKRRSISKSVAAASGPMEFRQPIQ